MNKTKPKKKSSSVDSENEIIIGLTPRKEEKPKTAKPKKAAKKKNAGNKTRTTKKAISKKKNPKREKSLKILKWIGISLVILLCIALFMLSDVFNVKEIVVSNNSKISAEEIIRLSGIQKDTNMFKLNIWEIEEAIRKNPYISMVKIDRKLSGAVNIYIEERVPTYMFEIPLDTENKYVYFDNQGYCLEVSTKKLNVPIITGNKTDKNTIEVGHRLITEDLVKLDDIIKIMDSAINNKVASLITKIDITNSKDYTLELTKEKKIIYFGDSSKISQKMALIVPIIKAEKGIEGKLFAGDVENIYFRECSIY